MPKPPDLEALARRYVELWQDQIAATAVDPELTEGLARMMQLVGGGLSVQAGLWQALWPDLAARALHPTAPPPGTPPNPPPDGAPDDGARSEARPAPAAEATGPAAVAGASDERGVDVAQLQARLALLEERLATLEGGPGTARRGTRPGARRRRAS